MNESTQTRNSPQVTLRTRLTGFAIVVLLVVALISSGALNRLELLWFDQTSGWLMRHSPTATASSENQVIVVGIDENSRKEFKVPVATLHRQIGQFLEAMAAAGARGVALDVVLPETSYDRLQPGLDAAVARGILAMRRVSPLILGVSAQADGQLRPLHPLFSRLAGTEGQGSVFVPRDIDGVARRFDERIGINQETVPTLSGQLARQLGATPDSGLIPMFKGPRIESVPLNQVLHWQADGDVEHLQAVFRNRLVLLGSLLPHEDQHRVPVPLAVVDLAQDTDTTHGVFIHAMQLRSLLDKDLIHELPSATVLLVAILLAGAWWLKPGAASWIGTGILLALLLALSIPALTAGWILPSVLWSTALLGGVGGRSLLGAWQTAKEKRRLHQAFDGSVSPTVLKEIIAGRLNPQLAGEKREICVLFSDIRGFTTLSEHMAPEAVTDLLNRYFDRMASVVHRHGGTLDKFIGDGIMAFFGAPQATAATCHDAFLAAQEMLEELAAFNREQAERSAAAIAIGIGLHFGTAFVGYIGAKDRHDYSAIGDTVNTASRLEGLTKEAVYPVVMSKTVATRLDQSLPLAPLGLHAVKGRAPIDIFGWRPGEPETLS